MKHSATIFIILLFFCVQGIAYTATMTSVQSGLFSNPATWGGNTPSPYDNIVISTGHTVTLDANVTVFNITINTGAVMENAGFSISIDNGLASGNPIYNNNGTHNGTTDIVLYKNFKTEITGSGTANCNFLYGSYGISVLNNCNLTINGNIQHSGNPSAENPTILECQQTGSNLTVSGNILTSTTYGGSIITVIGTTVSVNGDVSLLGSDAGTGSVFEIHGTFTITGHLRLGPNASYCQNFGNLVIGGSLLGSGLSDSYFWQEVNASAIFGGNIFPDPDGGLFFAVTEPIGSSSSEPNTIEYNGLADQLVRLPDDGAYSNLVINNSNATANVNDAITVNGNLSIKPGAAFTATSGSIAVTGSLTLESNASGTGSFITNGAISGTIQRYIGGHNGNVNDGWHLLSSPVTAQAISAFHTAGSGDDFYKWDEVSNTWINRTATGGGLNGSFETNFGIGTGYLVSYTSSLTNSFVGSFNNGNVTITGLSYTGANTSAGWHLLGNPFSSAVNWNNGNWNLSNVDANCQIWDEANASYTVIAPNGIIPAANGFMAHASVANASLTIPASARAHSNTNWYKQPVQNHRIVLTATDPEGGTVQQSIIRFDANATDGYDTEFDSYYLPGFAPSFYSIVQDEYYALNTLPELTGGLTIPMGFVKNGSQQFTISLTENIAGQIVYLTDLKTNQTSNLTEGAYTFSSQDGDDANRFLIHFGTLGIDKPQADQAFSTWIIGNQLYILSDKPNDVRLFDVQGRLLQNFKIESYDLQQYPLNLPAGVYIVRLQQSTSASSVKIIVQ